MTVMGLVTCKKQQCHQPKFHGSVRNGFKFYVNQSKKLFEKAGNLIKYVGVQEDGVLKKITDAAEVLKNFNVVVDSCFGIKCNAAYQYAIEQFCLVQKIARNYFSS